MVSHVTADHFEKTKTLFTVGSRSSVIRWVSSATLGLRRKLIRLPHDSRRPGFFWGLASDQQRCSFEQQLEDSSLSKYPHQQHRARCCLNRLTHVFQIPTSQRRQNFGAAPRGYDRGYRGTFPCSYRHGHTH